MTLKPIAAALFAAALGSTGVAYAANDLMTREAFKAEKDRIEARYESAKQACSKFKGNAEDVCKAEAKAEQRIADAELDARNKGTPDAQEKARRVRAEAEYDVAKEKCDDLSGNAKDVCVKDAKAAETKAKAEAKANRRVAEARTDAKQRTAEARKDAAEASRDADYRAARERCDQLAGDAKDACVRDVRAKYGKS
jgi:vacuolar-type H+-ATPase subunit H